MALFLAAGSAAADWKLTLVFLPLLGYFWLNAFRQTVKYRLWLNQLRQTQVSLNRYAASFSLERFLLQPGLPFRLSLALLLVSLMTVAISQPPAILSPVP